MKKELIIKPTGKYFYAMGRRKLAKASVMLFEGTGTNTINGKKIEEFFPMLVDRNITLMPLKKLDLITKFYFSAKTNGGGIKSTRDAITLGIARGLVKYDKTLKGQLKADGFLTRDDRMVERKHTGFVKARKKPQYSKR